ncbi:metal-dependent hydrolase [Patescibacteria group bacterium]|nr:metal-dependent hydrolase [Patescibacteria group bacterium]
MDVMSHAVWGATIVRKRPEMWWAAFIGALPDLLTALYGLIRFKGKYLLYMSNLRLTANKDDTYFKVYYFFHSLLPISVVAIVIYFMAPSYLILVLPYYFHIFLDVFTHRGIWGTRLFYPISNFHFHGRDWWKNRWISIINWSMLIVINLIFIFV